MSVPTPPEQNIPTPAPAAPSYPQQPVKRSSSMTTAGMVLGIIGLALSFIPIVGEYVGTILCVLAIIFGVIGIVKKHGGKAIAAVVMGIVGLVIAIVMSVAVYNAATKAVNDLNSLAPSSSASVESSSSSGNTSKFTQAIYDSIKTASMGADSSGNITYSGGTLFSTIQSEVGAPSSTSESSVGDSTTVLATWDDINLTGKSTSIMISYDKKTGQITDKNMTSF